METKVDMPFIKVSYHRDIGSSINLDNSLKVYQYCLSIWDRDIMDLYEEFYCLYLDRKNRLIGSRMINAGTVSSTIVNIPLLFAIAVQCNCSSIILAHNHPSGEMSPSSQDDDLTERIRTLAELFSMKVLDHLIVSRHRYYSYADEGRL